MSEIIAGILIPDSRLAREATDLLQEHGTPLLLARSYAPRLPSPELLRPDRRQPPRRLTDAEHRP
jgi:hypothetical protein